MSPTPTEQAKMEATPGPWKVGYRAIDVTAKDGRMKICDIRGWGHLTGKGACALSDDEATAIQTANARLIAAAPALYEALAALEERIAEAWPELANLPPMQAARNALALASGATK